MAQKINVLRSIQMLSKLLNSTLVRIMDTLLHSQVWLVQSSSSVTNLFDKQTTVLCYSRWNC